jgi:hypothetical protein
VTAEDIKTQKPDRYNSWKRERECLICTDRFNHDRKMKVATSCCVNALCHFDYEKLEMEAQDFYALLKDDQRRKEYANSTDFHGWPKEERPHAECPFCNKYPLQILFMDVEDNVRKPYVEPSHDDIEWNANPDDDAAWGDDEDVQMSQSNSTTSAISSSQSSQGSTTAAALVQMHKHAGAAEGNCYVCKKQLSTTPHIINYVRTMDCCGEFVCLNDLEKIKRQAKDTQPQCPHCKSNVTK